MRRKHLVDDRIILQSAPELVEELWIFAEFTSNALEQEIARQLGADHGSNDLAICEEVLNSRASDRVSQKIN